MERSEQTSTHCDHVGVRGDGSDADWLSIANRLRWRTTPTVAFEGDFGAADLSWFADGRLNVSENCVDRWSEQDPDAIAIIWVRDAEGEIERISFAELLAQVRVCAAALLAAGIEAGDRVAIYLPMMPAAVVCMLACARVGAVHSVVFAGFSAQALSERILDAGAKLLITADEALRGGKIIPLKRIADVAMKSVAEAQEVAETAPQDRCRQVWMVRRTGADVPMSLGRDRSFDDVVARCASAAHDTTAPKAFEAEHPLFILYTSGSTGKPKGILHTSGGYLVQAAQSHQEVFDAQRGDVWFCTADIGWITGHSYLVYGPLANGITSVVFESTPLFPDPGRFARVVAALGVTHLYTAPTAIRALAREGAQHVNVADLSTLRVLGTVGEPIAPGVWQWFRDTFGGGALPVVDTWWQTETGSILITPLAASGPFKPGAAARPFPGLHFSLLNPEGEEEHASPARGALVARNPWPSMARTIWRDHERFIRTYFSPFAGCYFTGDGAQRDADGDLWITGRMDDVLNVSGHRLGTAEIEAALLSHPSAAEVAVVGVPHDLKGTAIIAFVALNSTWHASAWVEDGGASPGESTPASAGHRIEQALRDAVRSRIGGLAVPDRVIICEALPKTRSGKLVRRLLRKLAEGARADLGDTTTLADEGVVAQILATLDREL